MNITELPYSVNVDGKEYKIQDNGSFRVMLDIIEIDKDPEMSRLEKAQYSLCIFYGFNIPADIEEASRQFQWFIACGNVGDGEEEEKKPIVDMVQDFPIYVGAINKVLGYDVRDPDRFTHWWTFVTAFNEIDHECAYSQIVQLRKKLRDKGYGRLEPYEREYYNNNRDLVIIQDEEDAEYEEFLKKLGFGD